MTFFSSILKQVTSVAAVPDPSHSVVLFASPRGGSTWATEIIFSMTGFGLVSEPLNLRRSLVRSSLNMESFAELSGEAGWERIEPYYDRLLRGRVSQFKPLPFRRFYRPLVRRIVIKQNQGAGDLLRKIEDRFGCRIIHALRHPIAVALSREVFPLLPDFHKCPLREYFDADELTLIDSIILKGSHLEQGVIAWCLHHRPALRAHQPSWFAFAYEASVMNPHGFLEALAGYFNTVITPAMRESMSKPSAVTRKSDLHTQTILQDKTRRSELVTKWKQRVSPDESKRVQEILNLMKIDLYSSLETLPHSGTNGIFTDCVGN